MLVSMLQTRNQVRPVLYGYQSVYVDITFPPNADGDYGKIYTNWKLGTDPMPSIVKHKYNDDLDYTWPNSGLIYAHSGHFLISLFANGDEGSPLTQLSYPVKIGPGDDEVDTMRHSVGSMHLIFR